MRYAGKQSSRVAAEPASGPAPTAACPTVANGPASSPAEIEQAVAAQGETVRQLKASKAAKADIDAAVAVLLDLKKQLVVLQGGDPGTKASSSSSKKGKNKK